MAHVLIPRIHRADYHSVAATAGFAPYLTIVDVEPALYGDEGGGPRLAQCAGCNFVTFLRGVHDLPAYDGLD